MRLSFQDSSTVTTHRGCTFTHICEWLMWPSRELHVGGSTCKSLKMLQKSIFEWKIRAVYKQADKVAWCLICRFLFSSFKLNFLTPIWRCRLCSVELSATNRTVTIQWSARWVWSRNFRRFLPFQQKIELFCSRRWEVRMMPREVSRTIWKKQETLSPL